MPNSNTQTAKDFLDENHSQSAKSAMEKYCTKDFTWWVSGAGEVQDNIDNIAKVMRSFRTAEGTDFVVKGTTSEGDRVAMEAEATTALNNGTVYKNQYHMLFEFRDGRICTLREYHNTAHAREIWAPIFEQAKDQIANHTI